MPQQKKRAQWRSSAKRAIQRGQERPSWHSWVRPWAIKPLTPLFSLIDIFREIAEPIRDVTFGLIGTLFEESLLLAMSLYPVVNVVLYHTTLKGSSWSLRHNPSGCSMEGVRNVRRRIMFVKHTVLTCAYCQQKVRCTIMGWLPYSSLVVVKLFGLTWFLLLIICLMRWSLWLVVIILVLAWLQHTSQWWIDWLLDRRALDPNHECLSNIYYHWTEDQPEG